MFKRLCIGIGIFLFIPFILASLLLMLIIESETPMRSQSQINKTSDLPNGVSRIIEYDKRYNDKKGCVYYAALVKVDNELKIKKFRVSKKASEELAKTTAIRFRVMYEEFEEKGVPFTKSILNSFDGWNDEQR